MNAHYKYFDGEKDCPAEIAKSVKGKFWHGESMFENTNQPIAYWVEIAKVVISDLERTNKVRFDQASKYTIEQFAVILYIEELFTKWNPYDNMEWIFEY